jgi:hypothetical protein
MTRIVVDQALLSKLHNLTELLELCDESGQLLARVYPNVDLSQYEICEPQIDEQEMKRREQSSVWYSTSEVLEHLQELKQG